MTVRRATRGALLIAWLVIGCTNGGGVKPLGDASTPPRSDGGVTGAGEPNETLGEATEVGRHLDCSDSATLEGEVADGSDVDFYRVIGVDTCEGHTGVSLRTAPEPGLELCMFPRCGFDPPLTLECPVSDFQLDAGGVSGCCSTGSGQLEMRVVCLSPMVSNPTEYFVSVRNGRAGSRPEPYTITWAHR